jgi:SPP1 gp7 family putative phage head morphogenesis protein
VANVGVRDEWRALFQQQRLGSVPKTPKAGEIGFTGNKIFAGLPMDEYNRDLMFPYSTHVYDEMRRSDGQIAAILAAVTLPIRSTQWSVEPEEDADDPELAEQIAEFVSDNLFGGMKYSWDDFMREALLFLVYGFSVFEKVWRFDKWNDRPVIMLDKYAPRVAKSIWRFPQDENYNIVAVQQINYMTGQMVDIPLERCRVFTWQREGDDISGISMLRPAYKHWYIKDALYKIVAIGIEKTAMGTPYAKLPKNTSEEDKNEILQTLANIRTANDAGVTIPEEVTLDILEGKRNPMDAMPFIEHQDTMIARSVLAQFINLGTLSSASGGSFALGQTMVDMFCMALETIANYFQQEVQKDIEQLVEYNWGANAPMPKLKHKNISFRDMAQVAQALSWLGSGHLIEPDEELENYIRDLFGIPPIPKAALENQHNVPPNKYNPEIVPDEPMTPDEIKQIAKTQAAMQGKIDPDAADGDGQPQEGQTVAPPPTQKVQRQTRGRATNAAPAPVKANETHVHVHLHEGREGHRHVHAFSDVPVSEGDGGEEPEPAGTKRWRRDLTTYEKIVKLDELNDKWDTEENKLLAELQQIMKMAGQKLADQIISIFRSNQTPKQKIDAINALAVQQGGKLAQTIQQFSSDLYAYGQKTAAEELGMESSQVPSGAAEKAALAAKGEQIAQQQMNRLATAIKMAAIDVLGNPGSASEKQLRHAINQAASKHIDSQHAKTVTSIVVGEAINTGRAQVAKASGIVGAQWSAILDSKTCPLCESLDNKIISVDDPDFDLFRPPIHPNCRCFYTFIGDKETDVKFDWKTPSGDLVKKYGSLIY